MIQLPTVPEVTGEDLYRWNRLKDQLAALKAEEAALRRILFGAYFPSPTEGTNTFDLGNGYALKGDYPIERKIDEAALKGLDATFREANISSETLVRWKPELDKRKYNTLTEEQKRVFDQCMTIKPGSVSLKIVEPKPKAEEVAMPKGQENL